MQQNFVCLQKPVILFLAISSALASFVSAQETLSISASQESCFIPINMTVKVEAMHKEHWSLGIIYGVSENLLAPKQVSQKLMDEANSPDNPNQHENCYKNLVKKNLAYFQSLFEDLNFFGATEIMFVVEKNAKRLNPFELPLHFSYVNGKTAMTISGIGSPTVFNTIRTTAKERASIIIEKYILPFMIKIPKKKIPDDFAYIGLSVLYGSRDFTKDSVYEAEEVEMLFFLSKISDAKQFSDGQMSDQKFITASTIYLSDRSMLTDFKRVEGLYVK